MSSKILRGSSAAGPAPVRWRRVDAPGGTPQPAQARQWESDADPNVVEATVQKVRAEAALRESQARQQGFREGEEAARKKLEQPYQAAIGHLLAQAGDLAGLRSALRREAEEDLVKLAVAVARRILRRELTADPGAILGIAKAALERLDAREVLRLRMHPAEAALAADLRRSMGLPERLEIYPDHTLESGAVIVETTRGNLDASVENQLREIERGFTDLLGTPRTTEQTPGGGSR